MNLIFDMQQGSFVCRLLMIVKIVTVDMLHKLFDGATVAEW